MADRAAAEKGWVVRVTVMEEPGKPVYHYFLTGCGAEAEAIAVVRSYPGILAEDNVKTMRPLSHTELSEFKESLALDASDNRQRPLQAALNEALGPASGRQRVPLGLPKGPYGTRCPLRRLHTTG